MLNTIYRLVAPRHFETEFVDIDLTGEDVVVRPSHLSICAADQRYYQGKRDPKVLRKKLPMALIHEGIGTVVYDTKRQFKPGQYVAMIPNTPYETDETIAENYLRSSQFRASGFDGFMQDLVAMRRDRLVLLPEGIDKNVAAFTELVSVSYHAINRFIKKANSRRQRIGVWGDGNVGFITALLLKKRLPESEVFVFGKHEEKLTDFVFVDKTCDIADFPEDLWIDHGFECVGGMASGQAINQMIDCIKPEGTISAMGVSEDSVPLNTRMILEKGLTIYGSSRSGRADFEDTIRLFEEDPSVVQYLGSLVSNIVEVNTIGDMREAFEDDIHKSGGKTIMIWNK